MSNNIWAWVGLSWTERIRMVLDNYGDRITDISIFGWRVAADGTLTPTFDPTQLDSYRAKWPHIRWWGCFRNMDDPNDGPYTIFESLRDSAAYRANLANEVQTKMFDQFPWLHGVDIDMEGGGNFRSADSEEVFRVVSDKAHASGRKSSGALPALTATGSVGGENWVRYKQLGEILDHVSVMSYDFAWSGSAPGPVSPGFWLEQVYDWASSQIAPHKVSMGLPLYAYFWSIHNYPETWGASRRGVSGTYYSAWQYFTGARPWSDSGTHDAHGWLAYRDESSQSCWGYLEAYDWVDAVQWDDSSGVSGGTFQGKQYAVRYGLPATTPIWGVVDNAAGTSFVGYDMRPEAAYTSAGELGYPKQGFTLTSELVQRPAIAATIIDDYATSPQQLYNVYRTDSSWSFEQVTESYKQYRGSGMLEYDNSFGTQSLYAQIRFQFAAAGSMTVYSQGFSAELASSGELTLRLDGSILSSTNVGAQRVGAAVQVGRCVLALRVREGSARVYFSNAETSIPLVLEATAVPTGGPTGYTASSQVWVDHTYLGDGWWFMPREAIQVEVAGQTKVLGRVERTGVTWNTVNQFRPDTDVEESETRAIGYSLDWVFVHWVDVPITEGATARVKIVPLDHDVWIGRQLLVDRDGASVVYFTDAATVTHWLARAKLGWGLQGLAMWSLGQEDVRVWDAVAGGRLPLETKRLDD